MCTHELSIPEPSSFEVEISADKLERYKSLGINQILARTDPSRR